MVLQQHTSSGRHAAKGRLQRLGDFALGKDPAVPSSAIRPADAAADTEIVPAAGDAVPARLATDYNAWLDSLQDQLVEVIRLARQGNRVAYNLLIQVQAKYLAISEEASQVGLIVQRLQARTGQQDNGEG
jgi:hypothetical protein